MHELASAMANAFEDELKKIARDGLEKAAAASGAEAASKAGRVLKAKYLVPAAAGVAGYETLRRANQDRRMGRAMRIQQGSY